jgi:hypothetical protein
MRIALALITLVASLASHAELVTDFSKDLPGQDAKDATISLRFLGIRDAGNVIVQLQLRNGQWTTANHMAAADYNQKSANSVQIGDLKWENNNLTGSLTVTIGPDSPRPNAKGFPSPADVFAITVDAQRQPGRFAPYLPDTLAFMPPWRKDEPQFGGEILTGKFTAKRGTVGTSGEIQGAINPAPVRGKWGADGNIVFRAAPDGGVKVLARLSPTRVAPPSRAQVVKQLESPIEMTDAGLRITVSSDKRRDDAAVMLAVKPVGRNWRSVTSAGLLLGRETSFPVKFDASGPIEAIAIGVNNQHGVGDVEFIVRKIETLPSSTKPTAPAPVAIKVTGLLNLADTTEIPKGLFGFHDVSPPKSADDASLQYLRDLKPGLLRPLEHTGFGGPPSTDEELKAKLAGKPPATPSARAQAADAVDNIILTHSQDLWNRPSWMDSGISNAAASVRAFYRNLAANAWTPGDDHNTLRKFEVWNEPFMWSRHINMGAFHPKGKQAWVDPTQYGFLPGKLGADMWSEIFLAAVSAKSINPHIQLGGPSSAAFNDDDYGCLEHYVGRIIERVGDKLDFLTEHHYGGDPRAYAASFEVVAAFCEKKVGRPIPVYNTEANDLGASSAGKAAYNIADILTYIQQCPDIVKGRALHALWSGKLKDEGEEHAYRLLAPLRGKLLAVESSDPGILAAGALNSSGEVVMVALNTSATAREVIAPGTVNDAQLLLADDAGPELQLRDTEGQAIPRPAQGKTTLTSLSHKAAERLTLPPRSAVRWTLPAHSCPKATIIRDRYFSDIVLQRVRPTVPATGKLVVTNPKAARAKLRVITRDVHEDEAVALLNGHEIRLPYSSSNDGAAVAQDIPVEPAWLTAENKLEFRCVDGATANGFVVYAACLMVER